LISFFGAIAPNITANYLRGKARLESAKRIYEAATPTGFHPRRGGTHSGNAVMDHTRDKLRKLARYLDENHDIAVSIFNDLTNNVIGQGVSIEPMVLLKSGKLAEEDNKMIAEAWEEWAESPETTGEMGFCTLERLVALSLFRDGEVFLKGVTSSRFKYRTKIPFVLEAFESDFLPFQNETNRNIIQGVELNRWRTPVAYHFFKDHPGDVLSVGGSSVFDNGTIRTKAENIIHLKSIRRLGQVRGITIIHPVLTRLEDLKDYEESERIAARVAASFTGFIERTADFTGEPGSEEGRTLGMNAGSIFTLLPGEKVGTIDSNRPNPDLMTFRSAMLRAVAGGTMTRYSSISKDYNGTYSAQRQELVEATIGYRALFKYIQSVFYRPVYKKVMERALLSGRIKLSRNIDQRTVLRADYTPPALPWIDPVKEAKAWQILIDSKVESKREIMRQRGRNPNKVMNEIEQEQEQNNEGSTQDQDNLEGNEVLNDAA